MKLIRFGDPGAERDVTDEWWKDFFGGLVVDFWKAAMTPEVTRAEADFNRALELSPGMFPNLAAHQERMLKRAAVKKTIAIESAIGYDLPAWFPAAGKTTD